VSLHISKALLQHSVSYEQLTGKNSYGVKTYAAAQTITNVRCVAVKESTFSKDGETKKDDLLMIYDLLHSSPSGIIFSKDDKITYDSNVYLVRRVESPPGDEENPVYYRVRLITDGN
jgi:hypothetical protein